ncbi:MAG: hypothetical protein AB8C46_09225 [Burkholderiaceae bacterium]
MSKGKDQTKDDQTMLASLRGTLISTGLLMLIGLALAVYGTTNYLAQVAFHHSEIEYLGQLRVDLRRHEHQLSEATELEPAFENLQQQGAIGALAKNLEADRFERVSASHPAGVRSFAMGAVEPIAAPSDLPFSTLGLGRHMLTFTARPRHEIHLLRFLGELPAALGGLSLLRACDISRSIGVQRGAQANQDGSAVDAEGDIRARCEIDWYVFGSTQNTALPGGLSGDMFDGSGQATAPSEAGL